MNTLGEQLAHEYSTISTVEAVALGGSRTGHFWEPTSDYDIYIYSRSPIPIELREKVAHKYSDAPETNNQFWESGDEWIDSAGDRFDIMFRDCGWIEEQLARVLDRHEASIGYTTAFCFNVKNSTSLFDRNQWFAAQQQKASATFPEPLRRNIVAKNHPILRSMQSSYLHQIEKAIQRKDAVSANHRIAALLASYFDILFALNRQLHPGEKRLLQWTTELCPLRPPGMENLIPELIASAAKLEPYSLKLIGQLLDGLDVQLRAERLI